MPRVGADDPAMATAWTALTRDSASPRGAPRGHPATTWESTLRTFLAPSASPVATGPSRRSVRRPGRVGRVARTSTRPSRPASPLHGGPGLLGRRGRRREHGAAPDQRPPTASPISAGSSRTGERVVPAPRSRSPARQSGRAPRMSSSIRTTSARPHPSRSARSRGLRLRNRKSQTVRAHRQLAAGLDVDRDEVGRHHRRVDDRDTASASLPARAPARCIGWVVT